MVRAQQKYIPNPTLKDMMRMRALDILASNPGIPRKGGIVAASKLVGDKLYQEVLADAHKNRHPTSLALVSKHGKGKKRRTSMSRKKKSATRKR